MPTIKKLFIGSFLSKSRGTLGVSEKIAQSLKSEGINIILSSVKEPKWQRLLQIIYSCATFSGRIVHIDVFSGQAFNIAAIAAFISRFRRKKIFITLHGGKLPEFYQQNPLRVEKLFQQANQVLTPSLYLKKFFEKTGHSIAYLPNSLELSKFPYSTELCYEPKLLWVRAFSPIYKPELAVLTLLEVRKYLPTVTLTMVGPDKGELPKIRAILKEFKLENAVFITGPISNDELYQYYHSHRVFLNTTRYESFGVAIMEAAACGIPVVSTPAGEIPLLWKDSEEMLITASWKAKDIAIAVLKLLDDTEKAESLRRSARKKAEEFGWDNIKPKWIELINE